MSSRLDEIRARCEAVCQKTTRENYGTEAWAVFCANAKRDLPYLLAECERLEGEKEALVAYNALTDEKYEALFAAVHDSAIAIERAHRLIMPVLEELLVRHAVTGE